MADFPWDFVADSPTGARHLVALGRVVDSDSEWVGQFTFDEPGEWVVGLDPRHLGAPADPALGARTTIMVGEGRAGDDLGGADVDPALLGTLAFAGAMATLLVVRLRRQQHEP